MESKYELGKKAEEGLVDAGGVEFFRFKALKTGQAGITLVYQRPRGKEFIDRKVFAIDIK